MGKNKVIIIFIISIIVLYMLDNAILLKLIPYNSIYDYLLRPIYCLGITIIIYSIPRVRNNLRLRFNRVQLYIVSCFSLFYVMVNIAGGFINGFGNNPMAISIKSVTINMIMFIPGLLLRESIRSYIVNSFYGKYKLRIAIYICLLLLFTEININSITSINTIADFMDFLGGMLIPYLGLNIIATFLVYRGGAVYSIMYLGIINLIYLMIPVLPDLNYITKSFLGLIFPIISIFILHELFLKFSGDYIKRKEANENYLGWMFTSIFCILLVWFFTGLFPIYPKVIVTGSMKPVIEPGDIVIVKKSNSQTFKVGDIVQYRRDNILIFHRIIETFKEKDVLTYRTKGDNNKNADNGLVQSNMVQGQVVFIVPKLGIPSLLFRNSEKM